MAQAKKNTAKKNNEASRKAAEKAAIEAYDAQKSGGRKALLIAIGIILALFLELSNFGILGTLGGWVKVAQFGIFGSMAYLFPLAVLAGFFYNAFAPKGSSALIFAIIFLIGLCSLVHLLSDIPLNLPVTEYFNLGKEDAAGGGFVGGALAAGLSIAVEKAGAVIFSVILMLFCLFMIFRRQIVELFIDVKKERSEKEHAKHPVNAGPEYVPADKKNIVKYKKREKTVYEEEGEDGRVIRIVQTKTGQRRVKRAQLTRVKNKAVPLRDGSVSTVRSSQKAKGVAGNVAIVSGNAGGDEVHEITNAKTGKVTMPVQPAPEKKSPELTVKDVTQEKKKLKEKTEEKPKPVQNVTVKPAASDNTDRPSLSGKTLSKGEPVRTFTPTTTVRGNTGDSQLPPLSLLARKKVTAGTESVEEMSEKLETVLATFGVNAKVIETQVGPSVTRFELQPELGTRVSKITSLTDDLKLNLAVAEIRLEAPIPGKSAIGIEIPNKTRQTVSLRELLESPDLYGHKSKIAFSAGKDISGNVIVSDLAKMPHLLVAGTTGSGKSVFLNSILMCILYRAKPSEVGLIIIDPKRVEFGVYAGIPHLMKSVVTDPGQAVSTLRWAVAEMTNRYQRMQMSGVRDFTSYNEKFDMGTLSEEEENPRRMPQIVIVVDELADLMMVAAKEVESLICRLAQLARAAGIHLIIATQRPSVDVVTGLIKANIPARAALLVASGVDSRTIIDMVGAEKLLGNGDMLFYPTGYVKPIRVQGAFVSDKEIADTVRFLINNKTEDYYSAEAEAMDKYMSGESESSDPGEGPGSGLSKYDEFFKEAGLLCIESGKASSSMLQRRFNVGFNRAARIIDQLEEFGCVGPANGAKPRELLMDSFTFEEKVRELEQE